MSKPGKSQTWWAKGIGANYMQSSSSTESAKPSVKRSKKEEVEYCVSYLTAKRSGDKKKMQEWRTKYDEPVTYNVLSQPVRHVLNKYFFDVTSNPSRSELKQLWYDLQLIDASVPRAKLVKWFQNKRQYMKRQYGRGETTVTNARANTSSDSEQDSTVKKREQFYRKDEDADASFSDSSSDASD